MKRGDGVDGQCRRHLACIVAAHAVSHTEEGDVDVGDEGVLVGLSNASDIGHSTDVQQPATSGSRANRETS